MQTYICLLRGINVAGKNPLKMDVLSDVFFNLDYQNISTYIQSGNVIFKTKSRENAELEKEISEKIVTDLGMNIPVLVLKKQELVKVIHNNFFVKTRNEDISKLHITFMSQAPLAADIANIQGGSYGTDEFVVFENVIYLFCPNGYGNTKLNNNFFESKLKVSCTTRNLKTVNELNFLLTKLAI